MTQIIKETNTTTAVARLYSDTIQEYPVDLYIPPEALKVILDSFEGPLDLLLYLIKKQNINILELPILSICHQYTQYIELMQELKFELAAEYLLMAAMLAEIKSRLLLPKVPQFEEDEGLDPRAELVKKLQEYERYKQAAMSLDELPRQERETCILSVNTPDWPIPKEYPSVDLFDILMAMHQVLKTQNQQASHQIKREPLSVREKMSVILEQLSHTEYLEVSCLWNIDEGRTGVIVTFLAILEMVKEKLIDCIQTQIWAPLHIKRLS